MATAATVYMSVLGPEGFREVARRSYQNAHYLAERVSEVPGYTLATAGPFFHEFVISTPVLARDVLSHLLEHGIHGGLDLATVDPTLDHCTADVRYRDEHEAGDRPSRRRPTALAPGAGSSIEFRGGGTGILARCRAFRPSGLGRQGRVGVEPPRARRAVFTERWWQNQSLQSSADRT